MDAVDCDVHRGPASYDAAFPYMSDYRRQYITEAGIRVNGPLAHAYPSAVGGPVPSSYEALAEHAPDMAIYPYARLEPLSRNWTNVRLRELRLRVACRHTGAQSPG